MEHNEINPLKFRPITEGLGLDHLSDTKPHLPSKKSNTQVNVNIPKAPRPLNGSHQINYRRDTVSMVENKAQQAALAANRTVLSTQNNIPAQNFSRIFAYLLDLLFISTASYVILWLSLKFVMSSTPVTHVHGLLVDWFKSSFEVQVSVVLLAIVFYYGYFLLLESTWKRSIGKAIFRIYIQSPSFAHILFREALFVVSILPAGIGLLWGFFDPRKRCWHDVLTDSEVISN
jgi:uncharacterized RDD family membrane protein YckC